MNEAYNIKILQAAGYDIENTVRELGSIDIYNELLNDFYVENLDRVKKIISYKKFMNLAEYSVEVHALKSECMYLGIKELAKKSEEQQFKSEAQDVVFINTHFNEYMTEIAKVMTVLKKYLGK